MQVTQDDIGIRPRLGGETEEERRKRKKDHREQNKKHTLAPPRNCYYF